MTSRGNVGALGEFDGHVDALGRVVGHGAGRVGTPSEGRGELRVFELGLDGCFAYLVLRDQLGSRGARVLVHRVALALVSRYQTFLERLGCSMCTWSPLPRPWLF